MRQINQLIEWTDVIDDMVNKVVSVCSNIGALTNMPNDLINNNTFTLASGNSQAVKASVNNPKLKTVNRSTVENQLSRFLQARGIINTKSLSDKQGVVITTKGILNAYNNFLTFLDKRLIAYKSIIDLNTYIFYDDSTDPGYQTEHITDEASSRIDSDTKNYFYTDLLRSITSINTNQTNKLARQYTCSSSSSSSSSSSCSSSCSCSSCSTSFIVYMLI